MLHCGLVGHLHVCVSECVCVRQRQREGERVYLCQGREHKRERGRERTQVRNKEEKGEENVIKRRKGKRHER